MLRADDSVRRLRTTQPVAERSRVDAPGPGTRAWPAPSSKGWIANVVTCRGLIEARPQLKQMLDDLNIRRNTWWGDGLHVVFDNIRVPFTAVGFRYDVNHGRWHGPNAGN